MPDRRAVKNYVVSVVIALAVGGLSALLTSGSMERFEALLKPPLAPPATLFPIVWSILFILMGVAAAMVFRVGGEPERGQALFVYGVQLFVNFFWTLIFFNMELRLFAFFWLLFLLVLVIITTVRFWRVRPAAGALMLPYIAWLLFAGYLNLAIYLLNG